MSREQRRFGLGFRPRVCAEAAYEPVAVDWFEIVSENYMAIGGKPRRLLEDLRSRYPLAAHGVALSIGGFEPLDPTYLAQLRALCAWLEPFAVSDHLCWTSHGRRNAHDLLPVHYTAASLRRVAARVQKVQDTLGRPILLENPSAYVAFGRAEMSEADFLAELCRTSGCGLLLDVNNLYVNISNLGGDALSYLDSFTAEAVGYIHVAGHSARPDVCIDTHDGAVSDPVWALYRCALGRFPRAATLLERDDALPPLAELVAELDQARDHARLAHAAQLSDLDATWRLGAPEAKSSEPPLGSAQSGSGDEAADHAALLRLVVQADVVGGQEEELSILDERRPVGIERGAAVYNSGYFFRIRDVLADIFETVRAVTGAAGFDRIVHAYLADEPTHHYSIRRIGDGLADFLAAATASFLAGWPTGALRDLAALDLARLDVFDALDGEPALTTDELGRVEPALWPAMRFSLSPVPRLVATSYPVHDCWNAVKANAPPEPPAPLVTRKEDEVGHESITALEALAFQIARQGGSLMEMAMACQEGDSEDAEGPSPEAIASAVSWLFGWFQRGLVVGMRAGPQPDEDMTRALGGGRSPERASLEKDAQTSCQTHMGDFLASTTF